MRIDTPVGPSSAIPKVENDAARIDAIGIEGQDDVDVVALAFWWQVQVAAR